MRTIAQPFPICLAFALAGCGGAIGHDFETDFATAKANATTLEGGAFDHKVQQRILSPEASDALARCGKAHAPTRADYRGLVVFDGSRDYTIRFEADDDFADCATEALEGREMPEPPERPYLSPVELGGKAK